VPVRALLASLLLALMLVHAAPADAKTKHHHKTKIVKKKKKKARKHHSAKLAKVPAAPAAPATCANTDLVPDAANLDLIRAAIVCLHNQIRAQYGLGALSENGALGTAAIGHSADMVARHYFDHTTPDGGTFDERILRAHYANEGDGWTIGENLAWGTGELSTPAGLMRSWMASPEHRENILKDGYREIGLGLQLGTPTGEGGGLTVSAEFGARMV
jgi:uncharacterized protein YkwD